VTAPAPGTEPLDTPLEIAGCRLHEVAVPLVEPFRISGGTMRTRKSLIVEVTDKSGAVGYGESAPFERPFYSAETLWSAKGCVVQHLFPRLAGQAFAGLEPAAAALGRGVRGNRMARAGVETALWDLVCAKAEIPLRRLIGLAMQRLGVPEEQRATRSYVESGAALGIPEDGRTATLADRARAALDQGYRRIKIKVMPGWDVAAVQAVRGAAQATGDRVRVWADANGAYARETHFEALQALDRERLVMLEQPLEPDDVAGTLALTKELMTPICLDESLTGERAAQFFLAGDGPRVWNLKVQRVGGLWESVRIYKRAVEGGVRLWAGSMPETGVGMHAVLCLASFAGFVYPSDAAPSTRWYPPGADLIEWHMDERGRMSVSDAPGLAKFRLAERLSRVGKVVA
jgi:o-succinylbenzoate synthase